MVKKEMMTIPSNKKPSKKKHHSFVISFTSILVLILLISPTYELGHAEPNHPHSMPDKNKSQKMYYVSNGILLESNQIMILFIQNTPHFVIQYEKQGFMFMFTEIAEKSPTNNTIKSINLETLSFYQETPSLDYDSETRVSLFRMKIQKSFQLSNQTVNINLSIFVSNQELQIEKQNTTQIIPANSVKIGVNITHWPFESISNNLQLKWRIHPTVENNFEQMQGGEIKPANNKSDVYKQYSSPNLEIFEASSDFIKSFLFFEKKAILDNNTPALVTSKIDDQNHLFNMINVNFPHFNQTLSYDPFIYLDVDSYVAPKQGLTNVNWEMFLLFIGIITIGIIGIVMVSQRKGPLFKK